MIGAPIPDPRKQVLEQLNASIDQFFAGGGKAEQLPGPSFIPRRPRPIPGGAAHSGAPGLSTEKVELAMVRELAKTMTLLEAAQASGISRNTLYKMARQHLFCFQSAWKERNERALAKQAKAEREAKLATAIRANSLIGVSRHAAAKKLGISDDRLKALIAKHNIDFPTWYERS